jgi:hypothetical protein
VRILGSAGRFVYDFVIGDDWKIAAAVLGALAVGLGLLAAGLSAGAAVLTTATLVGAGFTIALVVDVRRAGR